MSAQRGKCVGLCMNCGQLTAAARCIVDVAVVVHEPAGNPEFGSKLSTPASTPNRC